MPLKRYVGAMKWTNVRPAIFLLSVLFFAACQSENQRLKAIKLENPDHSVQLEKSGKKISERLMGFNIVYPQEKDEIWQNGVLINSMKEANTSVLRYPGGTVVTFYHWDKLTGNGWMDKWDTENTTPDKPSTEYMDVDEYMEVIRKTGAMPMMGINMSSGWRFNRMEEGIQEALALMKYCKEKDFPVTYWYLDNEPYQPDGNGGRKTPEQYGELVNIFAERMKAYDPNIKIVANWNSGFDHKRKEHEKLIAVAGKNIDMMDVHWYWSWGNPTWEKWISGPMSYWTGPTYVEEIAYFRGLAAEMGYPDIELGSFEWNVGPAKEGSLSPAQCALMQSEMMMQFMNGGLDMAIMWPMHWTSQFQARGYYDARKKEINPIHQMYKFLGQFQGAALMDVKAEKQDSSVYITAALSDDETLRIILLNKGATEKTVALGSELFGELKITEAKDYILDEAKTGYALDPAVVDYLRKESRIAIEMKSYSITMLTLSGKEKSI